ncbi:HEAT repeat-containing protein 5B [Orchesella cincta]|uniref:HEAT repeat-containing protein 5B n=1 Tax=Orchesella cincta TaxID=48709 RepID=A0A1D2M7X7_ORCCI|nr:HEAT repeat-containing protein 5B [Orchesella cincta]
MRAQFSVVKVLAGIHPKQMNSIDFNPENAKECNQETIFNQHLLVCALQELAALFLSLGTSMYHLRLSPQRILLRINPPPANQPASQRVGSFAVSASQFRAKPTTFDTLKTSPEAVSGYSAALSSILGGVRSMPLGIPHATGKIVFNTAEELLRTASKAPVFSIKGVPQGG